MQRPGSDGSSGEADADEGRGDGVPARRRVGSRGGENGQGEHGQGDVPVPGGPVADLAVVQAYLAFRRLETRFDAPPDAGDPDQLGRGHLLWGPAEVEGELAGGGVAADQQVPEAAGVGGDPGPVVAAGTLRSCTAGPAWRPRSVTRWPRNVMQGELRCIAVR